MFEGKFYNGRTSKGMPAFITLEPGCIRIAWSTGEEQGNEVWDVQQIHKLEFSDSTTILEYGGFPRQSIAVFEQGFKEALEQQYRGVKFLSSGYNTFLRTGVKGLVIGGLSLLLLAVTLFFWGIPMLAESAVAHFPEEYEQAMGEGLYNQIVSNQELDSAKTEALQTYLNALQVTSDFPIKATVVKNETVNAFAMPGGFVVVHDALLDKMEHHEELAGLLGHEIGHVQMRHSTKAIARSLSHYMLLSVLFGDVSGISAVILDNASSLYSLEYSRKAETESDKAGLQLLTQNQLNPQGMVLLMERLISDEPEFLKFVSTHPRTAERIEELNAQINTTKYKVEPNPALEAAWKKLKE